jgi:hypothetical protein
MNEEDEDLPKSNIKLICETIGFVSVLVLIGFMAYNDLPYWGWLIFLLFMF